VCACVNLCVCMWIETEVPFILFSVQAYLMPLLWSDVLQIMAVINMFGTLNQPADCCYIDAVGSAI